MEGLRQIDELAVIRDKLPDIGANLLVVHPLEPSLRALSPLALDVFQLAYNHQQLATVLNQSAATDLDTARVVLSLLDGGYLRVE
ncbi:MAG: hypothetical protein ABJE95_38865, partial [Byssovorax sp.]